MWDYSNILKWQLNFPVLEAAKLLTFYHRITA